MKVTLLASAIGLFTAAEARRFPKTVDGERRTVRTYASATGARAYQIRPSNSTFDMKTEIGMYTRTSPFVRTQVFNTTADLNPLFGFRVGVLRLAELTGDLNAVNATNVLNLNSTDGSLSMATPFDETVNGTTIKKIRSAFTARTGTLPRTSVVLDVDIALGNYTENGMNKSTDNVKWDVAINNFKYQASGDSKLAMVLSVNTPKSMSLITNSANTITGVKIDNGNGTFTWNSTILVNNVAKTLTVSDLGTSIPNLVSSTADSSAIVGETAHYLQFVIEENKPQNIFWDPTNSFDEDAIIGNGASSMIASLGALAVAAFAILA